MGSLLKLRPGILVMTKYHLAYFRAWVTTHNNGDHGWITWLVHNYVKQANGDIIVDNNNPLAPFCLILLPEKNNMDSITTLSR